MQGLEHVAREIGGVGARCESERDVARLTGIDYRGDGGVEGKGFAPSGFLVSVSFGLGWVGWNGDAYLSTQRELLSRAFTGPLTCVSTQNGHSV